MDGQREIFVAWLETQQPLIPTTTEVRRAWQGWQAALAQRPRAWLVVDDQGQPHFSAGWSEACHEHINDALAEGFEDAKCWHVVPVAMLRPND